MYNLFMNLFVYFVEGNDTLEAAFQQSKEKKYERMFILNSKSLQHNRKYINSDKILIFNHNDFDLNCSIKLAFLYSEPIYDKLIFIFNLEFDLQNFKFSNESFYEDDNILIISRNYVIFNDFNFKRNNKIILDPIEMFENINKALSGEIVDEYVFKEALKELLPIASYSYDSAFDYENFQYKKLINDKNTDSKTKYIISKEKSASVSKNIVFTLADYDNFKYVLRRDDGLKCYIF